MLKWLVSLCQFSLCYRIRYIHLTLERRHEDAPFLFLRGYSRVDDDLPQPLVSQANKKPSLQPVNLNTATALELQQVPGIGPSTADKILEMRRSYGQFKSVDDLRAIKGIGPERLEKMRKYVTVGKSLAPKKPASSRATSLAPPSTAKSPPRASPNTTEQVRRRRTETRTNFKKKNRPEGRALQKHECGSAQKKCTNSSSKYLVSFFWLFDAQRHLIGDADAVAFEGDNFLWMIRQNADVFQAQVD